MSTEFKEIRDEFNKLATELREKTDAAYKAAEKRAGEIPAEFKTQIDRISDRLDAAEAKMNRPAAAPQTAAQAQSEYHKAYSAFCRKGPEALGPDERKVLTVSNDNSAGYLASPEITTDLLKTIVEFSPVRALANVRSTSQKSVKIRKRTGTFSAVWVSEVGTRAETTGLAYGVEEIPTHEVYAQVAISNQDLEDSDFNMEAQISMESGEQFGVAEGTAFISGSGVGKPQGVLSNSSVASVNSGHATQLTADGLIRLAYALKSPYADNGTFGMNRLTLREVRILKDGAGRYLWEPGLAGNRPPTLLERPYVAMTDLAAPTSGATFSASAKPIIFGDWRRGYTIVDRLQVTTLRDPYSSKNTGTVDFQMRKRLGGQVVLAEALVYQLISA